MIEYKRFKVFDWILVRCTAVAGTVWKYKMPVDIVRSKASTIAMYTKGLVLVTSPNGKVDDRVPGLCTAERPNIKAGEYTMEAAQDAEWWCFDKRLNPGGNPQAKALRVKAGTSRTLPVGSRIVLLGDTPQLIDVAKKPYKVTATQDILGFVL